MDATRALRDLGVAELDETSRERAEGIVRSYLEPTFGDLKAGKPTAGSCTGESPSRLIGVAARLLVSAVEEGRLQPDRTAVAGQDAGTPGHRDTGTPGHRMHGDC
ncbi:hypothetical protein OHS70_34780 [Streptomyces sp. NBC_00390]|uniref:hypothetical protein n=1 Tax=Streptomyces sp. NBC_00390 TaxID=2975736 RepID=UPI002E1AD372